MISTSCAPLGYVEVTEYSPVFLKQLTGLARKSKAATNKADVGRKLEVAEGTTTPALPKVGEAELALQLLRPRKR